MTTIAGTDDGAAAPLLCVVAGRPDTDELAALVAVVAAVIAGSLAAPDFPEPAGPSRWRSKPSQLGAPHRAGPHAWRASSWLGR